MPERPNLDRSLDGKSFRNYYYLKEELIEFCRKNNLPVSGGKIEITDRIAYFLDTGKIQAASRETRKSSATSNAKIANISKKSVIESNFVCSEIHRAFFKEHIGNSFSFNVAFQKWLKANAGKTYAEAVIAYGQILEDKKKSKTKIDKQFEYNTYIRAFFEENKGKSLEDAIRCWKYKKSLPGHNRYEKADLAAITIE